MSGFRGWVPLSGTPERFPVTFAAESASGGLTPFATALLAHVDEDHSNLPDAAGWNGPDFIVIGAQRSGSTSLYRYLSAHPLIEAARIKELHYFSLHHQRPLAWYRSQFPLNLPPGHITGEATPYYLFHPHAARRIAETAPRAKLIAVLRNPIDRAHSHYHHELARGVEWLSFEDAIRAEPERIAGERERLLADPTYASAPYQSASYLSRGRYAEQLREWLDIFPRDQLLIVR
ncbi:MAG: sulfotransferase domain-containing protein, partial [Thermomicrobiales bacterium]